MDASAPGSGAYLPGACSAWSRGPGRLEFIWRSPEDFLRAERRHSAAALQPRRGGDRTFCTTAMWSTSHAHDVLIGGIAAVADVSAFGCVVLWLVARRERRPDAAAICRA